VAETIQGQIEEIRESRRRILRGHESFRQEVANEIHGPVQTRLLLLSFRLDQLRKNATGDPAESEKGRKTLREIREEIDVVREQLRDVSHRLYPPIVRMGLVASLRSLCDRFGTILPVYLRFHDDFEQKASDTPITEPGKLEIPKDSIPGIYRAVEESLSNVVKHAEASSVEVDISRPGPNNLSISVKDNGVGFDISRVHQGIGLGMIHDYVQAIGGWCSIESVPNRGTTLRINVPLSSCSRYVDLAPIYQPAEHER